MGDDKHAGQESPEDLEPREDGTAGVKGGGSVGQQPDPPGPDPIHKHPGSNW